ncbi:hypothetical protein BDB00DRAFT_796529 [Zychaea mexicana]|uniref:uncharacterized protein n=1 Tax=Zychaea mexicana TaxID=64656 RepID=UPI0022FDE8CD|nr:uncharacterized protein BDB00DRAFT_796529 [Zychaea mexicana]KAI9499368.1 hypothetical protein BDB00DRAFT_796529 [Zychaea mexicana]
MDPSPPPQQQQQQSPQLQTQAQAQVQAQLPQTVVNADVQLPPGWLTARQPGMQRPYYYNSATGETSWTIPPMPPPGVTGAATKETVKPKSKKKTKKPIPGTEWLLVQTPDGLEFFYHKPTKKSVWELPEELKEPVEKMKEEEREQLRQEQEKKEQEQREREQREREEREDEQRRIQQQLIEQQQGKRKMEEEENDSDSTKRAKHEENEQESQQQQQQQDEDQEAAEMTEEDLMYQLQAMEPEELAAMGLAPEEEGEGEHKQQPPAQQQQPEKSNEPPQMLEEERIELFTQMLSEKDISPFTTWERELPKMINDERYSLIQPLSKRKNLFDNFCRVLAQEHKAKKPVTKPPEEQFMSLLKEEATAKMYWDDFRRKVKNDSRFKAIREIKTRESMFKDYVKKLRKEKDASAASGSHSSKRDKQRAYMDLLKQTKEIHAGMRWRDAKVILEKDSRYLAIESKHLREDLYRDYLDDLDRKRR